MKISIITVVFNNKSTLEEAIHSVSSQEYSNIEYIIIDGGSTDGTVDIIKRNSDKIDKWDSSSDQGIYDAMNKGVLLATGDIIGILNSDDIYADNQVLNDVSKCFSENSKLDILYGDLVYVRKDNVNKIVRKWKSVPYYNRYFEQGNVPPHPTLFITSRVYKEAGLFDLQYKLAADYEFMIRIFKASKYSSMYFNRLMIKMRLGGATNRSVKNILEGNREIIKAWRNNGLTPPITLMPLRVIKRLLQFFNR